MAMTAAQRRKADRERKRLERQEKALTGKPPRVEAVNAAVVEAVALAFAGRDARMWYPGTGWQPINLSVVIAAATDILVNRYRYDPTHAKAAVVSRIAPRKSHRMPTTIPSLRPDPGMPCYRFRAPDAAVVHAKVPDTPVTSSDTVA